MSTDADRFLELVKTLDCPQQRQLAAHFIEPVLDLTQDGELIAIVARLKEGPLSEQELQSMNALARQSIVNTHCPCGEECDWQQQAAYFVARAVAIATEPEDNQCFQEEGLAWKVAGNARMARVCSMVGTENSIIGEQELKKQLALTESFIQAQTA